MKKILVSMALLSVVFSCSVMPDEGTLPVDNTVGLQRLVASTADATKVNIGTDDNVTFFHLWEKGDEISVFDGATNLLYTLDGDGGSTDGTFLGPETSSPTLYAVYPYSDKTTIDTKTRTFRVEYPAMQHGVAGSYDPSSNVMIGLGTNGKISFSNAASYVQVNLVSKEKILFRSLDVLAKNGEPISGSADVVLDKKAKPVTTMYIGGNKITVAFDEEIYIDEDHPLTFYVALPPVFISGGLEFILRGKEGTYMAKSSSSATLERNTVLKLPELAFAPILADTLTTGMKFNAAVKSLINTGSTYSSEDNTIKNIVFEGGVAPVPSANSVDVSASGDGSVLAFWDEASSTVTVRTLAAELFLNEDPSYMFYKFYAVESIENLSMLNSSIATTLYCFFYHCDALKSVDLSWMKTPNVTSMYGMFEWCAAIEELDFSMMNVQNVESLSYCFAYMSGLKYIKLGDFNPVSAKWAMNMFRGCTSLETIDVKYWYFNTAWDFKGMFSQCKSLTSFSLDGFYAAKANYVDSMFRGCSALESFSFGGTFAPTNLVTSKHMFSECEALPEIDLTGMPGSRLTNTDNMFRGCTALEKITIPDGFFSSRDTMMRSFFYNCSSLKDVNVDFSKQNTSGVKNFAYMFYGCTSLSKLDLSGIDTKAATTMSYMFSNCGTSELKLDLGSFNTSNVTTMTYMFANCKASEIILYSFDVKNVTSFAHMFDGCSNLTDLDVSMFIPQSATSLTYMFANCPNLESIYLGNVFKAESATTLSYMFANDAALKSVDMSKVHPIAATTLLGLFYGCSSLESVNLANFEMPSATTLEGMFYKCSSLKSVDMSDFETSKVTSVKSMFYGCSALESLDFTAFNLSKVTDMSYLAASCPALKSVDLGGDGCNTAALTNLNYFLNGDTSLRTLRLNKNFRCQKITGTNIPAMPAYDAPTVEDPLVIYCRAEMAQRLIQQFAQVVPGVNARTFVFYSIYDNNVDLTLSQEIPNVTTACTVTDDAEVKDPTAGTSGTDVNNYNADDDWTIAS